MSRHSEYKNTRYGSSERREIRGMCNYCMTGDHSFCDSELCPCVCNDDDFRWARNAAPMSATQAELAYVISVRPELAQLLR